MVRNIAFNYLLINYILTDRFIGRLIDLLSESCRDEIALVVLVDNGLRQRTPTYFHFAESCVRAVVKKIQLLSSIDFHIGISLYSETYLTLLSVYSIRLDSDLRFIINDEVGF